MTIDLPFPRPKPMECEGHGGRVAIWIVDNNYVSPRRFDMPSNPKTLCLFDYYATEAEAYRELAYRQAEKLTETLKRCEVTA